MMLIVKEGILLIPRQGMSLLTRRVVSLAPGVPYWFLRVFCKLLVVPY